MEELINIEEGRDKDSLNNFIMGLGNSIEKYVEENKETIPNIFIVACDVNGYTIGGQANSPAALAASLFYSAEHNEFIMEMLYELTRLIGEAPTEEVNDNTIVS